jgi:hypothetical protein
VIHVDVLTSLELVAHHVVAQLMADRKALANDCMTLVNTDDTRLSARGKQPRYVGAKVVNDHANAEFLGDSMYVDRRRANSQFL